MELAAILIHLTLADGRTALFWPHERVACDPEQPTNDCTAKDARDGTLRRLAHKLEPGVSVRIDAAWSHVVRTRRVELPIRPLVRARTP